MSDTTTKNEEKAPKSAIICFAAEECPQLASQVLTEVRDTEILIYQHGDKKGFLIPGLILLVVHNPEWELIALNKRTNIPKLLKNIEDRKVFLYTHSHPHIVKVKKQDQ
ncbi:MAG: hypothetical protein LAT81_14775 [Oceanicaulis sp.]|nr:hypothetical protein [Oceanicaulis sp.]